MKKIDLTLLYYIVKDYVSLPREKRFTVGTIMEILDREDTVRSEDEMDVKLIKTAIQAGRLSQLVSLVNRARHESR